MSYTILNSLDGEAAAHLRAGTWPVGAEEPHGHALAAGDLALVYLGAPAREFIGRATLASAVKEGRVAPAEVEEWDPPVAMNVVLASLDPSAKAEADFDVGVVRITEHEYETVLALAAGRVRPRQ